MTTSFPNRRFRLLHRAVPLGIVLVLLLVGCGSGDSTRSAITATEPTPTPIPTTPPLSLPPADVTLPDLAPLPSLTPVQASVAASEPATQAATTASPTADEAPSEVSSETAEAAPIAAVEPSTNEADTVVTSTAQWSECVLRAADSTGTLALLDPIAAGTDVDMTSVQLNTLAAATMPCDMVASGLSNTAVGDYLVTGSSCMQSWLESSGGGSVFVGLASLGWGQSTPVWAQGHLVDAIAGCFTGASFAADVMSVVAVDTSLNGAFDASCLATSFDASGTMRAYAQALASNPATAQLFVSLSDSWVLSCANVGQMVAAAASADGVALSTPTIACIDSELKNSGAVAQLLAGTADTDAVGIATIACLTDAEATALLG